MTSTFSDYPTMPSHDFDLYSSTQESYPDFLATTSQPYVPATSYLDGPYTSALTSLDSYNHAYNTTPKTQTYQPEPSKGHFNPYTPPVGGSPNLSHNQPPNLTSSESGTSIHSTSTTASPSLHPQYQTTWDMSHGLGLGPGIVPHDSFTQDAFVSSGIEHESISSTDKLPGFVGEFNNVSSNFKRSSVVAFPSTSSTPHLSQYISSQLGEHDRDTTPGWMTQYPSKRKRIDSSASPVPNASNALFKTPTMPASAITPTSPVGASQNWTRSRTSPNSGLPARRRNSLLSNQVWPPAEDTQKTPVSLTTSPVPFNRSPSLVQSNDHIAAPSDVYSPLPLSLAAFAIYYSIQKAGP